MKKYDIPVADACIGDEEAQAVYDVVLSGWISMGEKTREFEQNFAEYVGAKHAIAVSSGTAALHVALIASGISDGNEVIVPDITFVSTANVCIYERAVPVVAECHPDTYNITSEEIERRITDKTRAIIPVDMNGMPFDYDSVLETASKHHLKVIVDSAESLGARYKGRRIGSLAPVSTFSFFPNKNITTGEGGMIATNDDDLANRMRIIRNQGQDGRYNHVMLGYNYRMTDILAALGNEQLKRIDWVLQQKRKIVARYNEGFRDCKHIFIPYVPEYVTTHAWYMYTITVEDSIDRDDVVAKLKDRGIGTRLSFPPIHIQPYYRDKFGFRENDYPASLKTWRKLINLPIWAGLGSDQVDYVIENVIGFCE